MPRELSGNPDLPSFSDRLPDLVQALRNVGRDLQGSAKNQSYIPYWEDLYAVAHSLKGVVKILNCPEHVAAFMFQLNEALLLALSGTNICRRTKDAGDAFLSLAQLLDQNDLGQIDGAALARWPETLKNLYTMDLPHEARREEIPAHLFHVDDFVTKKAREINLLHLNQCVVEDQILLDEIALWRTQLNEALTYPEFGRGLVVNFLPFISPEGSRKLKVWAWVAAASHNRASLKQRIKEVMPKVNLAKI